MAREYSYQYEEDLDNWSRRGNISLCLLVASLCVSGIMLFGGKQYDSQELKRKAALPAAAAIMLSGATAIYYRRYNDLISNLNNGTA